MLVSGWWRWLTAVLLVVGIVLSPLRAVAATLPMLIAYDAAVAPTATAAFDRNEALRPEVDPRGINNYDGVYLAYGGPSNLLVAADVGEASAYGDPPNPPVAAGTGAVHACDRTLDPTERRELAKGVIYDAPAATTAAEGLGAGAQTLSREASMWEGMGQLSHGGGISADTALESGAKWVGEGYKEVAPGVFRSSDGLRQFRMMTEDLVGAHGDIGPHVHFESLNPLGRVIENNHVPLLPDVPGAP